MKVSDFKYEVGYYTAKLPLWEEAIHVDIDIAKLVDEIADRDEDVPEEDMLEEYTLKSVLPAIEQKLVWLNEKRSDIEDSTIADGMDELASDWLWQMAEYDGAEARKDEDGEYISVTMEDGKVVSLPVGAENFKKSLYPVGLMLTFRKSTDFCTAYLELCCDPDYFDGHRVHISINEKNQIECDGI